MHSLRTRRQFLVHRKVAHRSVAGLRAGVRARHRNRYFLEVSRAAVAGKNACSSSEVRKSAGVTYKYNEGFTQAVRRPVYMSDLM